MSIRRLKPATVPVHPLLRQLHAKLEESALPVAKVAKRAGFDSKSLRNWWRGHSTPTFQDLEAAFNALGYEVKFSLEPRQ